MLEINRSETASLPDRDLSLWRQRLTEDMLPLWSTNGYDRARRLYHERLAFDGTPIAMKDMRLMVQARQISTFCRAAVDDFHDMSANALECLSEVRRRYYRVDGQPGWVFALSPDGQSSNTKRDLYAHAFVLFAHAWAYRLCADPALLVTARETISEIQTIFGNGEPGFLDTVPHQDGLRRQNPHMHLLEAYLALFEVSADGFYLEQASELVELALSKFVDPASGMVIEFLNAHWQPSQPSGQNRVEAGHLFEWSWLLQDYLRLNPDASKNERLSEAADRLFKAGMQHGLGQDVVYDAMTESGAVIERSTRIWPQTELCRLLACRKKLTGAHSEAEASLLKGVTRTLFQYYALAELQGGWIDRRSADGRPSVDHMPASSLYHIYGAAREF